MVVVYGAKSCGRQPYLLCPKNLYSYYRVGNCFCIMIVIMDCLLNKICQHLLKYILLRNIKVKINELPVEVYI